MKSKLIRDNIITIASNKWQKLSFHHASEEEFIQKLKEKLLEETQEVINAQNNEELYEELADLTEILLTLYQTYNINSDTIELVRTKKLQERWGFTQKIILDY